MTQRKIDEYPQLLTPGGDLADENTVTETTATARAAHVLMPVSECVQYHPSQHFYAEVFPPCQALYHITPLLKSLKWLRTATETQSKPPALQDCPASFQSLCAALNPQATLIISPLLGEPSSFQPRARVCAIPSAQSAIPPGLCAGERCPA